jgi:NADH-quinone oxidoreductase subunit M
VLVGLLGLYFGGTENTFDLLLLSKMQIPVLVQKICFPLLFVGFGVFTALFPFHTWVPDGHSSAPTAGSMFLAGISMKLGGYGFLRFSLPVTPDASHSLAAMMIVLSLIAVIYIGLVALVQADMKKLVAYSSIAHMGFVTLGFFMFSDMAVNGAIMQMISHGFVSGAMFLCIGVLYDRLHSREIADYGGVINVMPRFAALFMLFSLANAGLPATSGFIGEFMVILGAVKYNFWIGALAATALILGAAYSLWLVKRVVLGEIKNPHVTSLADLTGREFFMLGILAIAVLWMGVYPAPFTDAMQTSVNDLLQHVQISKLPH